MKKLLLFITVPVILSGCATSRVASFNVTGIEKSQQFPAQDLRPSSEKEQKLFSLLVTSSAYGIYRLSETLISPTGLRLLQHRTYEALHHESEPLEIKVYHLVVYQNMKSELRRSAFGAALGGIAGALIAGKTVKAPSGSISSISDPKAFESLSGANEYKRALYSDEENPGSGSVLVTYVDTEINGKRVFTRTISPIRAKTSEIPLVNALEDSLRFHLSQYLKTESP